MIYTSSTNARLQYSVMIFFDIFLLMTCCRVDVCTTTVAYKILTVLYDNHYHACDALSSAKQSYCRWKK